MELQTENFYVNFMIFKEESLTSKLKEKLVP